MNMHVLGECNGSECSHVRVYRVYRHWCLDTHVHVSPYVSLCMFACFHVCDDHSITPHNFYKPLS